MVNELTEFVPNPVERTASLSRSLGNLKEDLVKDRIGELSIDHTTFFKNMVQTFPCSDKGLAEIKQHKVLIQRVRKSYRQFRERMV